MTANTINFCYSCGSEMARRSSNGDSIIRPVCTRCGTVHYENPKILVTTLINYDGKLLLCRRAQPPAKGLWALPGGFVESGETLEQAACRETREETGVITQPENLHLHALSSLPGINEVYVGFRTEVNTADLCCGVECLNVDFFDEQNLPWGELAYTEIDRYLRVYFAEVKQKKFAIHLSDHNRTGVSSHQYCISSTLEKHLPQRSALTTGSRC